MKGVKRFWIAYATRQPRNMGVNKLTLHQLELPCPTTAHAHIPDPALLYHVMQSLHGFFNRRFRVKSMELQDIDIFELKPLERVLYRSKDPLGH
jgi:hypothetical protein